MARPLKRIEAFTLSPFSKNLRALRSFVLKFVAPGAKPPVARIMDYGKFRFEQQKKEREARKKQDLNELL
jgi:hypothetical protein